MTGSATGVDPLPSIRCTLLIFENLQCRPKESETFCR
jgi:hypothetical protein